MQIITEDHKFIDARGNEVVGRERVKNGWNEYFGLFPDYKIEVQQILESENTFGIFGFASGSYKGKEMDTECRWKLPAAWRAYVVSGKMTLWQVYADTKTVYDIIEKYK